MVTNSTRNPFTSARLMEFLSFPLWGDFRRRYWGAPRNWINFLATGSDDFQATVKLCETAWRTRNHRQISPDAADEAKGCAPGVWTNQRLQDASLRRITPNCVKIAGVKVLTNKGQLGTAETLAFGFVCEIHPLLRQNGIAVYSIAYASGGT